MVKKNEKEILHEDSSKYIIQSTSSISDKSAT